jgi:hypothetical protein
MRSAGEPLDVALQAAQDQFISNMPKVATPGDTELINEHIVLLGRMAADYERHWADTPDAWTPIAIETQGKVEVGPPGSGVYLIFKVDEVGMWHNAVWMVDRKTAGRMDPRDLQKYQLDIQLSAYVYGLRKLTGMPVAGAIIDYAVKTKVPQFTRDVFTRTTEDLQEFEDEWLEVAREIAWRLRRIEQGEDWKTVLYKNTNECFSYGTCWYRDLCVSDTPTRRLAFKRRDEDYVEDQSKLVSPAGERTPEQGS